MKSYYHYGLPLMAMIIGLSACSEDKLLHDTTSERWQQALNGTSDKSQDWTTAVNLQLDIIAQKGDKVSAYAIGRETPTLLAQEDMQGNGVMRLDVPQGIGYSIGLVCDNAQGRKYQRIYLSGEKNQIEDVDFINQTNSSTLQLEAQSQSQSHQAVAASKKSPRRVISNVSATPLPNPSGSHNTALNGNSVTPLNGYNYFGGWAWEDLLKALPEGIIAEKNNSQGVDYEFTSDGYQGQGVYGDNTIVGITYLYGYTGNTKENVFGYYTHTEGTFSDLQLHDLGETLNKDFLASPGSTDYKSKVQYQLDGTDKWYDANFYYLDGEGILVDELGRVRTADAKSKRAGDGVCNTFLVHNNYGERVSAMRGLTYKISIPKGLKYGFYLRLKSQTLKSEHKTILQNAGVDISAVGNYEINFSNAKLNMAQKVNNTSKSVYYRSSYKKYDNFSFLGFDDSSASGDADCNDVTFGFLDADGKPGPHVYNEAEETQSWTIGFENLGQDVDFDFNDVVLRVTPNPLTHKAKVELLAAGCNYKTEVYFGQTKLCEVHEAFGQKANEEGLYPMINTGAGPQLGVVNLGEVDWPASYTMTDNGSLFHTVVDADGKRYEASMGRYIGTGNDVPTAVCVAGEWAWPRETTSIFEAYPLIGEWGKNVQNRDYWNWYTQPRNDKVYKN